jgi:hypothetical protein
MSDDTPAKTETEHRRQYFDGVSSMVDRHRRRAFEYEKEAIEYSKSAFTALTYLNGGGLLAMPTAVALFHANIETAKPLLVHSGALYIIGLLCVVGAQGSAFFTMARRSEAEQFFSYEQKLLVDLTFYPDRYNAAEVHTIASTEKAKGNLLVDKSNVHRAIGLFLFWASLAAFICGSAVSSLGLLAK